MTDWILNPTLALRIPWQLSKRLLEPESRLNSKAVEMRFLGMLCLGGFVGGLLSAGMEFIDSFTTFQKISTTILGAAFSGVVFSFISKLQGDKDKQAAYVYPIGLVLALMWRYAPGATAMIQDQSIANTLLGSAHLLALVLVTILAVVLVLPKALQDAGWLAVYRRAAPKRTSQSKDKQKGKWGRMSKCDDRRLYAEPIHAFDGDPATFKVRLLVESTNESKPLPPGQVIFHLHEDFEPFDIQKEVRDGKAIIELAAIGAFTVGAETSDSPPVQLELDLADKAVHAPRIFKES